MVELSYPSLEKNKSVYEYLLSILSTLGSPHHWSYEVAENKIQIREASNFVFGVLYL